MTRTLHGNSADPYRYKIKKKKKKGYAAQCVHITQFKKKKKRLCSPMMKMLARLTLIKFLTQTLQLYTSHGFHWSQLATDKPASLTAIIIPGTTSDRYLGLQSSRIHTQTHGRLHLHPVATGNLL